MANIVICDARSYTKKFSFAINLTDGPSVKYPMVWAKQTFKKAERALGYVNTLIAQGHTANPEALNNLKKLCQ